MEKKEPIVYVKKYDVNYWTPVSFKSAARSINTYIANGLGGEHLIKEKIFKAVGSIFKIVTPEEAKELDKEAIEIQKKEAILKEKEEKEKALKEKERKKILSDRMKKLHAEKKIS